MARVRNNRKRAGVSVVEMSVVMSLLVVLSLGAAEYGWMFLTAGQVATAARDGARYAATADVTTVSQVTATGSPLMTFLAGTSIPASSVTVSVPTGVTPGTGNPVTVTVSLPYSAVALTGFSLLPIPTTLTATVTMAKEGS